MKRQSTVTDRRLFAALDFIDQKYIDDVFGFIKDSDISDARESVRTWKTPFKAWKQFVALAACLILLSVAFPMVTRFVSGTVDFFAGFGSGSTEESSDLHHLLETDEETVKIEDTTNVTVNTTHAVTEETTEKEITWNPGPCYLEFEGLEPLTEEQMYEIRDEWAQNRYDRYYSMYWDQYSQKYDQETARKMAEEKAQDAYDDAWGLVFNEYYYTLCGYYGIINECIILSFLPGHFLEDYKIGDFVCQAQGLYAYKDGEFYDMKEAYDINLLSEEQVRTIFTRINQREDAIEKWKKGG